MFDNWNIPDNAVREQISYGDEGKGREGGDGKHIE